MVLLIQNGLLIDPANNVEDRMDLLVEGGKVAKTGKRLRTPRAARVIDATGWVVAPGFIDLHVHFREPGREDAETIESGAQAAAAGGFTSVVCMPDTQPVNDNEAITRFILERAAQVSPVNVFPAGALTSRSEGETLSEMGMMREAGIVAVTDDGRPVPNAQVMRRAMEYARRFDLVVMDHCEDPQLSADGAMHEGYYSTLLGLRGISPVAEEVHIVRDLLLAELTGARLHLAHLSTRGALEMLRQGKKRGVAVTAEVTPHHFTLTDAAVVGYNTNTKMKPPLRSQEDVRALIAAMKDGTVDAIATDHAPHNIIDKNVEYDRAAFGIVGLETCVSLALDRLYHRERVPLRRLVELLSTRPARIIGVDRGHLSPGAMADITLLDPERSVRVDVERFKSRGRNSPFHGWELRGAPVMTMVKGRVVWQA